MALSNYQLILLDNLIYLDKIVKIKSETEKDEKYTVANMISDLLDEDKNEIENYWKDDLKEDQSEGNQGLCLMKLDEWKAVLTAIQNDETLMNMKISNVSDSDSAINPNKPSQGTNFRAACFSNDEETVIVFRGTHGAYTWNDNGEGGYQSDTASQQEALDYVNLLGANLTTSGKITVTGHSKGGNLAQYVTICAANLIIDRCVSFDGQGFSNEFFNKHEQHINIHQDKLYSVNSAGDFVNPILNTLVPESHRMYVASNAIDGFMDYHKPNNVFQMTDNGTLTGLNYISFPSYVSQLVNDFICFTINYPTNTLHTAEQRNDMIDTLLGLMEANAYYDDDKLSLSEALPKELLLAGFDSFIRKASLGGINLHILEKYEKEVQEDIHLDRLSSAIRSLTFYMEEYIRHSNVAKMRILCTIDDLYENVPITITTPIINSIPITDYTSPNGTLPLIEIIALYMGGLEGIDSNDVYNHLNAWREMFSDNQQYAQSTNAGEQFENIANTRILSEEPQPDGTTKYTWLEPGTEASGDEKNNIFIGNFHNNILHGNEGSDELYGGNGNDTLYGGDGNDYLYGGKGNDILCGGTGADTYVIESHDGIDTIYNSNYKEDDGIDINNYKPKKDGIILKDGYKGDTLYFGVNVNAKDIKLSRGEYQTTSDTISNDLYVYYHGYEDTENYVIIKDFFYVNENGEYPYLLEYITIEEEEKKFIDIPCEQIILVESGRIPDDNNLFSGSNSTGNNFTGSGSTGTTPSGNNSGNGTSNGSNGSSGTNSSSSETDSSGNTLVGVGNTGDSISKGIPSGDNSSSNTTGLQEGISPLPVPDGDGGDSASPGGGDNSGNGDSGSPGSDGNGGRGSGGGDGSGGSGSVGGDGSSGSGSAGGNGGSSSSGRNGGRDVRDRYRRSVGIAPVDMENAEKATVSVDPIIIDLNQDGIYTQSVDEGIHFDFAGDGYREETGWAAPQDGILVRDINGDGIINDGTELFGDRTVLGDGSIADRGFVALKDLDSNEDGKLNREDDAFSELKVWVDHNGNGVSEEGELYTLDEKGISEIRLDETTVNYTDEYGNRIMAIGNVQMSDGTINQFAEVKFKINTTSTIQVSDAPIDETIKETMPELYPSGMLLTLQQAMTADEVLYQKVKAYMDATTGKQKLDCLEQLIHRWAHADNIPDGSRGTNIDAGHLAILEAFYGKPFVSISGSNPNYNAAILLDEIYDKLLCDIDMELMVQTTLSPFLDMIMVQEYEDGTLKIDFDTGLKSIRNSQYDDGLKQELMAAFIRAVNTVPEYKANVTEWVAQLKQDSYYVPALIMVQDHNWMTAEQMKNRRLGNAGNNVIYGSDNAEIINVGNGNDIVFAGGGDDNIIAGEGDDVLYGGTGNDTLQGNNGADTYILNLGDGEDSIINYDTTSSRLQDKLIFGEGILPENLKLSRKDRHLIIQYSESDAVTVEYFFDNKNYALEHIVFADGSEWTLSDIEERLRTIQGSAQDDKLKGNITAYGYNDSEIFFAGDGNDYIYGETGDDILYGEAGDDTLYGGEGDDVLYGGTGNDKLSGNNGADTYILNLGDGKDSIINYDTTSSRLQDKLVFGEGILPENLKLSRKDRHLIIQYSESDTVTVEYFFENKNYALEHIVFADGSEWTLSDIEERLRTIQGSAQDDKLKGNITAYGYNDSEIFFAGDGNDYIYGETGDDILYGEAGDDTLYGGEGDDVLYGGTGNDKLSGNNGADTYILNLGDGEDSIINYDTTSSRLQDKLVFGEGILPENLKLSRKDRHLIIQYSESDTVTVEYFFENKNYALEHIVFADGSEWTLSDIADHARIIERSAQSSTLRGKTAAYGYNDNEIFFGGDETDYIYGETGDDILFGKAGNDTLGGGEGNDLLNGGTGNDTLRGDNGDDIYFFSYGCGYDTISNADNNETSIDTILFGNDVSIDDISVAKSNNDLILFIRQHDAIKVSNYYKDAGSRIDQIAFADGTVYHADAIETLVNQCEKEAVPITNAGSGTVDTDAMNRMNLLIQTMNSMEDNGTIITGQPEQTGSNIPDSLLCFFKSN